MTTFSEPVHEAASFDKASNTDLLQEMIDRSMPVHGVEVHKGWLEIHGPGDVVVAEQEILPLFGLDERRPGSIQPVERLAIFTADLLQHRFVHDLLGVEPPEWR